MRASKNEQTDMYIVFNDMKLLAITLMPLERQRAHFADKILGHSRVTGNTKKDRPKLLSARDKQLKSIFKKSLD